VIVVRGRDITREGVRGTRQKADEACSQADFSFRRSVIQSGETLGRPGMSPGTTIG
jgi:hypothetical protein